MPDAGAVYVFTRDVNYSWAQQAYIKAASVDELDGFGFSVALSAQGSTLAVGAFSEDSAATGINGDSADNSASLSGAAYVFTRDGAGTWRQQAYVKASNTEENDYFAYSVTLSDDGATLAVGSVRESSAATGVNGDEVDNSEQSSGAVYVFTLDGSGTWTQIAYVKASNTDYWDEFGHNVMLSADGATLAVTARGEDSPGDGLPGDGINSQENRGAAYVFNRDSSGIWNQQGYVKPINHTRPYSFLGSDLRLYGSFGNDLALSADGSTLVIGTDGGNDSAPPGLIWNQEDNTLLGSGVIYGFDL